MRVLVCGTVDGKDAEAVREVLAQAAHGWGIHAVVCTAEGLPVQGCASLGVDVKTLHDPDARARLETITWLLEHRLVDRVLALPGDCDLGLYVKAFEHFVPVWEVVIRGQEAILQPLPIDRARARWINRAEAA
ncbi:MAG: hypothetical protein KC613_11080 [Myxococcales bacterium]|nr:hypothetical protein [Myxococcales bacterium]MCB9523395.1 hypothetical protein [Myxococcales bacterium]